MVPGNQSGRSALHKIGRILYKIVKRIHFCYGHRLLDYNGKCAHPHGHNGLVEVEIQSPTLNELSMVIDFNEVRDRVEKFVMQELDHRMLLRKDDPLIKALKNCGEDSVALDENPTAETIARIIFEAAQKMGLPVKAIRLWESRDSCAEYRQN